MTSYALDYHPDTAREPTETSRQAAPNAPADQTNI